jgi:hypothetical protein
LPSPAPFVDTQGLSETNEVCTLAATILEQKAVCQQDPDQDETEEAPEETAEYDTMLIASAGDLVAALATTLGAAFTPLFRTFYPLIVKYYVSSPLVRWVNEKLITRTAEEESFRW